MGEQTMKSEQLLMMAVLVLALLTIVLLTTTIVTFCKVSSLNKKYKTFMRGSRGLTLESTILSRFEELDIVKEEIAMLSEKLETVSENLVTAYQKIGVIRYDAFKEMGGKLSFSLCLLDDENSGIILTSMHTKEGCYTYVKEIIKGEAFVILSTEERRALEEAKNKKNFYAE